MDRRKARSGCHGVEYKAVAHGAAARRRVVWRRFHSVLCQVLAKEFAPRPGRRLAEEFFAQLGKTDWIVSTESCSRCREALDGHAQALDLQRCQRQGAEWISGHFAANR